MKNLNKIYWSLTVVMLLDVVFYLFLGISFIGYWIDLLILWTWLILTPIVIVLQFRKKWVIRYLISLLLLIILSILPMGIPFLTIVGYAITVDQYDSYKLNSRIKLKENVKSVIAPMNIQVIKSYFIFEKVIAEDFASFYINEKSHSLREVESIKQVENTKNDSLLLAFKFKEGTVIKAF